MYVWLEYSWPLESRRLRLLQLTFLSYFPVFPVVAAVLQGRVGVSRWRESDVNVARFRAIEGRTESASNGVEQEDILDVDNLSEWNKMSRLFYGPETWDILWPNIKQPNWDYGNPPPRPVAFPSWLGMCLLWKPFGKRLRFFIYFFFRFVLRPSLETFFIFERRVGLRFKPLWPHKVPSDWRVCNCVSLKPRKVEARDT